MRLYVVTIRIHVTAKMDRVIKYIVMANGAPAATKKIAAVYPDATIDVQQWNADAMLFAQYNEGVKPNRFTRAEVASISKGLNS